MIRITVYSGPSATDDRKGEISVQHDVFDNHVHEVLAQIGLEWKTADYMPQRQVVITLDPVEAEGDQALIRDQVRSASEALERTGLL